MDASSVAVAVPPFLKIILSSLYFCRSGSPEHNGCFQPPPDPVPQGPEDGSTEHSASSTNCRLPRPPTCCYRCVSVCGFCPALCCCAGRGSSHDQLIQFWTAIEKPLKAHEVRRGKTRTSSCLLVLDVCLDSTQIYNLSGFFLCPLYCTGGWLGQS